MEMVQVSDVIVILKEIQVKNLHSTEENSFDINPYLKYAYSKDWYVNLLLIDSYYVLS